MNVATITVSNLFILTSDTLLSKLPARRFVIDGITYGPVSLCLSVTVCDTIRHSARFSIRASHDIACIYCFEEIGVSPKIRTLSPKFWT